MKTETIKGSKEEIAARIASIEGDVREAILFIEDSVDSRSPSAAEEDIFAEMEEHLVYVADVDYSRERMYDRTDDE